jgi:hypothetical protein
LLLAASLEPLITFHFSTFHLGTKIAYPTANKEILDMNQKALVNWFSFLGIVGALLGIVYAFLGLGILPVSREVLVPWGNGVYGATFIGFSVTIFFAGRHAFRKNDVGLMKALLFGTFAWLITEALFSVYYRVFFNVAVDIGLMLFFGFPLIKMIKVLQAERSDS